MSHALQFDEPGRPSVPLGHDAPSVIADTLRTVGIDAPAALYNEALSLAREGLLGPAVQRLQMLVALDPDDADAHLLLAKVFVAQGRPGEALTRLEAAVEVGAAPPAGFREQIESLIRADRQRDEEHRARIAAREQSEIKALRQEARNLRSETIRLEAEVTETKDREKLWRNVAMLAAGATAFSVLAFALVTLLTDPNEVLTDPNEVAASAEVLALRTANPVAAIAPAAAEPLPPVASAGPAVVVAAPAVAGRQHTVVADDTLYRLAAQYYGDAEQWERIRDANQKVLKGKIDLKLGQTLIIP